MLKFSNQFFTTTFDGSAACDTAGWDTIYALRVGVVNEAILQHFAELDRSDNHLQFDVSISSSVSMKGQFGPWQITTGGSGTKLHLFVPIISGTAHLGGTGVKQEDISLAGGGLTLEVPLGFHPVDAQLEGAIRAHLKIATSGDVKQCGTAEDIKSSGSNGGVNDDIVVIGVSLPNYEASDSDSLLAKSFITTLANTWLKSRMDIFDYVFLSIDVGESAAQGEWSWIRPTYVGYAITDHLDNGGKALTVEQSILAVMSLTEGRIPGTQPDGSVISLSSTVSSSIIPNNNGVNAAFAIHPSLLLTHIIGRNVSTLFDKAKPSDFSSSATALNVTNQQPLNLKLEMDPKWWSFGSVVDAHIPVGCFSISLRQTSIEQLFSNITFKCGHSDEVTVQIALGTKSTLGIDEHQFFTTKHAGNTINTLSVQPDGKQMVWDSLVSFGINLVVTVALCFIPFGGAAAQVEESAASEASAVESAVREEAASSVSTALSEGNSLTTSVVAPEAEVLVGAGRGASEVLSEVQNPATWSFKGIMSRFQFKVWALFAGQFAQQIYQELGTIDLIKAYDREPENMPTLKNFLSDCLRPAVWTNTGEQELKVAGLNGAFVMGFSVPVSNEKKTT